MRVRGRLTTVRRAAEEDADLLVRWHADPDVARYWDDEVFTRDEMLERLRRPDVEAFVIEEKAHPVGYLQVWAEGGEGGLDMFLVPDARGRGLGPDAARATLRGPSPCICGLSAGGRELRSTPIFGTGSLCVPGAAPGSATSRSASRIPSTRRGGS